MKFFIIFIIFLAGYILYNIYTLLNKKVEEQKYHKMLASSGIKDIDKMDGLQFEFYLKALFKELGYRSTVTNGTNDFGADLVMIKNDKKIVVQAKRYKYKNNVGVDAVQQIYTAIPYYKANKASIITNSQFTKNAKILADVCNVELIDRKKLVTLINKIKPSVTPNQIKNTIKPKDRKCPNCKDVLIVRKNNRGNDFFGCSNYPKCTHTEPIAK